MKSGFAVGHSELFKGRRGVVSWVRPNLVSLTERRVMSLPLARLEAKLSLARKHHPEVERHMRLRGELLRNAVRKQPELDSAQSFSYRYKGTEWRCHIRIGAERLESQAVLWWFHGRNGEHRKEALDALLLREGAQALHFDSHFFCRWGLRTDLMGVMLTNMMGFFRQYPCPVVKKVHRFYPKQPEYAAALDQGLLLARSNGKLIISCDTFKHHDILSHEEKELWRIVRGRA